MSDSDEIKRLAAHFRTLGASKPEQWAESEIKQGIPQYARFVFLKAAWDAVISEENHLWIDNQIAQSERKPGSPCASAGSVLKRMLSAGISRQDITDLARVMQYQTLFALCYQLSDSSVVKYPADALPQIDWALMQIDEEGKPIATIDGLHESVLSLDPTGREMHPRG